MNPIVAILLLFISPPAIADTKFALACEKLATEATIRVVFEDQQVIRDDSRSIEVLKRLSQSDSNPYHSVLGLTHAEPSARIDVTPHLLTNGDGQVCGVASIQLKLSFSAIQVYLASDLKDSCRRRIVDEHEQEHVAAWRSHLKTGARLMESMLRNQLGRAAYFISSAEAKVVLRQRVDELIVPLLKKLNDGIGAANQQIDSASSYQYVEGRMRACP